MKKLALLATVAAFAAAPALAQPQPNAGQPLGGVAGGTGAAAPVGRAVSGTEFMRMAAASDRFEIESSRLAQERAQGAEIKRFAEEMVRDHTKTTQELQQLLQRIHGPAGGTQASGAPPAGPQAQGLDTEQTQMIQRLQDARGPEFDRLYMRMQVQSHQKAVDLFASYARQGDHDQIRSWASQTLPDLQQHLQRAQQIAGAP